jgi:hypothetical protein
MTRTLESMLVCPAPLAHPDIDGFQVCRRVKADPGRHPKRDEFPVMKLNLVEDFATGIYDYHLLTSAFVSLASVNSRGAGAPTKLSFSAQEWCGHTYAQVLFDHRYARYTGHSYFDGEADGKDDLALPKGGLFEDALPILLRGWNGAYLKPGESRSVPFLPSLFRGRLAHQRLAWGKATITRSAGVSTIEVPAGRFAVVTWTVSEEAGATLTYSVEAAPPYRVVRFTSDAGEEAVLLGSSRQAYWKLNAPGGEKYLRELGLKPPSRLLP